MKKTVKVYKNQKELSLAAAGFILKIAKTEIKKKGYFTLAVSGGQSPVETYRVLAKTAMPWNKTYIFWQDDRFVKYSGKDSNVKLVFDNMLQPARMKFDRVYPSPAPDIIRNPAKAAYAYETIIKQVFKKLQPNAAIPSLDLIIAGIGRDGHTASLFPGAQSLDEKKKIIMAVKAPKGSVVSNRITMTMPFINAAKNIIVISAGHDRKKVLNAAIKGDKKYPAALLKPTQRLIWMVEK
jgi:6-phosphogluconolactonase